MGVEHQAAESRRLTTRALERGLEEMYNDPGALAGARCVKTKEFELKVACLFEKDAGYQEITLGVVAAAAPATSLH